MISGDDALVTLPTGAASTVAVTLARPRSLDLDTLLADSKSHSSSGSS